MYTIDRFVDSFTETLVTLYYREGRLIAYREEGSPIVLEPKCHDSIELTRAQGFKYWERHFPNRSCYTLPEALAKAIERTSKSSGCYFNKNGELCGYEG